MHNSCHPHNPVPSSRGVEIHGVDLRGRRGEGWRDSGEFPTEFGDDRRFTTSNVTVERDVYRFSLLPPSFLMTYA